MLAVSYRRLSVALITGVLALAGATVSASAQDAKKAGPQYSVPANPDKKCVHDADPKKVGNCDRSVEFMRRNHMNLLVHKRDMTMHKGIRTKENALQNCINCHVTKDDAGKPLKVSSSKHFCASCHEYASVKLDCFECHRSTPDTPASSASIPRIPAHASLLANNSKEARSLGAFLKGVAQ